jgi:hypothetical protein
MDQISGFSLTKPNVFFFRITQYNVDAHNIQTLTPMNARMQTLPLRASSQQILEIDKVTTNVLLSMRTSSRTECTSPLNPWKQDQLALFIRLIIRTFQLVFSTRTLFFSHNKSVNMFFSRLISTAERSQYTQMLFVFAFIFFSRMVQLENRF